MILEFLMQPVIYALIKIVLIVVVFVMTTGTVMTLMERKWSSAVQDRIGPNRANIPFLRNFRGRGALHMAADGLKSIFKEDTIPANVDRVVFTIAPFFGFIAAVVVWAVIPFAAPIGPVNFQIADVNIGILLVFAVTSLGVYGTVLAGWSSNNKFALLGAARGTSQMLSYEIFLGLSLVGVFMVHGTVQVSEVVANQNTYWFVDIIPKWGVFTQPVAFVIFFTAMLAEAKRLPFDIPEGDSEIIAGYFLEYSGMRFSAFMLSEYMAMVGIAALVTTLFFGGYHVPWLHADGFYFAGWHMALPAWLVPLLQIGAFISKIIFFCWFIIILRWTIPRFRFDQVMELGWKKMLPLSLANIVVTALVLLAVDHWNL